MSDFYKYSRENMDAMGAPAPEHLFGNLSTAIATTTTLVAFVDKFGTRVTVIEMIKAGTRLERLTTVGSWYAAYYAGVVIGSLAVAAGRTLAGGTSIADVLLEARKNGWGRPWLTALLQRQPAICNPKHTSRSCFHAAAHLG